MKHIWDWIDARPHRFPLILLAYTTFMIGLVASVLLGPKPRAGDRRCSPERQRVYSSPFTAPKCHADGFESGCPCHRRQITGALERSNRDDHPQIKDDAVRSLVSAEANHGSTRWQCQHSPQAETSRSLHQPNGRLPLVGRWCSRKPGRHQFVADAG